MSVTGGTVSTPPSWDSSCHWAGAASAGTHSPGPLPLRKLPTVLVYGRTDIKANMIQAGFLVIYLLSSIRFLLIF